VAQLYDKKAADEAEQNFTKVIQEKQFPEEVDEFRFSFSEVAKPRAESVSEARRTGGLIFDKLDDEAIRDKSGDISDISDLFDVSRIIVKTGQAKSRNAANILIVQGAVSIDGKKISGNIARVKSGSIIKVGKHRYIRVINTDIE
jgi:tyrosyl-tRNA synthetase